MGVEDVVWEAQDCGDEALVDRERRQWLDRSQGHLKKNKITL